MLVFLVNCKRVQEPQNPQKVAQGQNHEGEAARPNAVLEHHDVRQVNLVLHAAGISCLHLVIFNESIDALVIIHHQQVVELVGVHVVQPYCNPYQLQNVVIVLLTVYRQELQGDH